MVHVFVIVEGMVSVLQKKTGSVTASAIARASNM